MSRTVSRLLLTLSLLVGSVTTYILLFAVFERNWWPADADALGAASLVMAPVFAVLWTSIWHGNIVWSASRVLWTSAVLAVGSMTGVGCYAIWCRAVSHREVGVLLATMFWMSIWMAGTAVVWKETKLESLKRNRDGPDRVIACPKCGYDLKGLTMARCPECGTEYTLDELFGAWVGQNSGIDDG